MPTDARRPQRPATLAQILAAAARRERDPQLRRWLRRLAEGDRAEELRPTPTADRPTAEGGRGGD
jgi:hypothetical protein